MRRVVINTTSVSTRSLVSIVCHTAIGDQSTLRTSIRRAFSPFYHTYKLFLLLSLTAIPPHQLPHTYIQGQLHILLALESLRGGVIMSTHTDYTHSTSVVAVHVRHTYITKGRFTVSRGSLSHSHTLSRRRTPSFHPPGVGRISIRRAPHLTLWKSETVRVLPLCTNIVENGYLWG